MDRDRVDPGKVFCVTREVERRNSSGPVGCVERTTGTDWKKKRVHMLTHGAKCSGSFVVWDASDSQAKSRLVAESFGYNRSSFGSHLFSRASLLAIVKDDDDVARQDALLSLSLSLSFSPVSLPRHICVCVCVCVRARAPRPRIFYVRACENVHRRGIYL